MNYNLSRIKEALVRFLLVSFLSVTDLNSVGPEAVSVVLWYYRTEYAPTCSSNSMEQMGNMNLQFLGNRRRKSQEMYPRSDAKVATIW